jgi:hypothetical protein
MRRVRASAWRSAWSTLSGARRAEAAPAWTVPNPSDRVAGERMPGLSSRQRLDLEEGPRNVARPPVVVGERTGVPSSGARRRAESGSSIGWEECSWPMTTSSGLGADAAGSPPEGSGRKRGGATSARSAGEQEGQQCSPAATSLPSDRDRRRSAGQSTTPWIRARVPGWPQLRPREAPSGWTEVENSRAGHDR